MNLQTMITLFVPSPWSPSFQFSSYSEVLLARARTSAPVADMSGEYSTVQYSTNSTVKYLSNFLFTSSLFYSGSKFCSGTSKVWVEPGVGNDSDEACSEEIKTISDSTKYLLTSSSDTDSSS